MRRCQKFTNLDLPISWSDDEFVEFKMFRNYDSSIYASKLIII